MTYSLNPYAVHKRFTPRYYACISAVLIYFYMKERFLPHLFSEIFEYERVGPAQEVTDVNGMKILILPHESCGLQNPLARSPVHIRPIGVYGISFEGQEIHGDR